MGGRLGEEVDVALGEGVFAAGRRVRGRDAARRHDERERERRFEVRLVEARKAAARGQGLELREDIPSVAFAHAVHALGHFIERP